jgi:hypothetical protein
MSIDTTMQPLEGRDVAFSTVFPRSIRLRLAQGGYGWAPRTHDLCVLDSNVIKAL